MSVKNGSRGTSQPARRALSEAKPTPFWLDSPNAPDVHPALVGDESADLTVVGGGFTGLWTALTAKERDPSRDVVVLERQSSPSGASGRNGGFMLGAFVDYFNLPKYPGQEKEMMDIARDNRAQIEAALARNEIDCDFSPNGWVITATRPWHHDRLKYVKETGEQVGLTSIAWDRSEVQDALHSPEFLAGVYQPEAVATVHPGKLAWGLKRACERAGVRFFENTPATSLDDRSAGIKVKTSLGSVTSAQVALATYAHPSLIPSLRHWRIPVYSHVLATEPLTAAQMDAIGWEGRQGFIDLDPFLFYYRLTKDNRIIWGYVDATSHWNRGVRAEYEQDFAVFDSMAAAFMRRFPQLEDVNFSHRWGGALDTSSRAAPLFGTTKKGRVAYALGYQPGVGASRAGATIMLDLLEGASTPYTQLKLVSGGRMHGRPSLRPFPPEPFLSIGMKVAHRAVLKQQETGQHNVVTKTLERLGFILF